MTANHPMRMDPADFLAWEVAQNRKHELVGGVIKLMAGATRAHLRVQMNLGSLLNQRLRGKSCEALAEVKVTIPNRNYRYADVAVDCGPQAPGDLVATGPRVVFEVESPTTGAIELLDRLADYQSVGTIDHIVVVAQSRAFARIWTRGPAGWSSIDAIGLDADMPLPALELNLKLADVYDGVSFLPPADD
jgi:Uma2 family endonuclease